MAQYRALDLDEGVTAGQDSAMKRRDALYLFYNLMITKNKEGTYYLNVLEPTLNLVNTAGELDRVALINSAMEGPVVASSGWQSQVGFDTASATVYRNGGESTLSAVQNQDVVYWSESMHTIWAYSNKVTGIYESAAPSASNPTSVTVAGKSYDIETTEAAYQLSDLGGYQVGDSVTLLLGRNGGVAAVGEASLAQDLVYGVVLSVENTTYEDSDGNSYNTRTATIFGTDGNTYRYPVESRSLEAGALVRVTNSEDGVEIRGLSSTKLTGRVSSDGKTLGRYTLASDVQIIDTYETCTPIQVYPSRLAGANLTGSTIRFYALNAQGEISHMILEDATGDLHQYGIITGVSEVSAGLVTNSAYTYDVGGVKQVFTSDTTIYNLKSDPCQVKMESDTTVERLYNLTEVEVDGINGNTIVDAQNHSYTLSDNVAVYVYENNEYQLTSLERVSGGDYRLTAWYDKPENEGGRIRVILAR